VFSHLKKCEELDHSGLRDPLSEPTLMLSGVSKQDSTYGMFLICFVMESTLWEPLDWITFKFASSHIERMSLQSFVWPSERTLIVFYWCCISWYEFFKDFLLIRSSYKHSQFIIHFRNTFILASVPEKSSLRLGFLCQWFTEWIVSRKISEWEEQDRARAAAKWGYDNSGSRA
jgi:hypothetical protein